MKRSSTRVVVLVFVCLIGLSICRADELAAVTGLVTDPNGRSVPGVTILITNLSTNVASRTVTNDQGIYRVPSLQPGIYRMIVDKDGFKSIVKSGVELHVQDVASINFELQIGSVNETVTVEAGGLVINTTDASVSTVIDRKYVENMPLNGRSFQDLILLTPGVVTNSPQNPSAIGSSGEFSVNGQRTESNYYTVDGVSGNVGTYPGNPISPSNSGSLAASTVLGTTQGLVSVDALEEFRVQSSSYSAEYGRNPGGQFSFATRSGTNDWHGTAFDYLRNDFFDANSWFNNYYGLRLPPLRQNDFGGTLGGPITVPHLYRGRDNLFFFFSYEGLRLIQPQEASTSYVPTAQLRQSAPSALQPVLNAFPVSNCTPSQPSCVSDHGNGLGDFVGTWSNPNQLDNYSARLDYAVNQRLRLFFRFNSANSNTSARLGGNNANPANVTLFEITTRTHTFGATSLLSAHLSNDFRMNYSSNDAAGGDHLDSFGGAQAASLWQLQSLGVNSNAVVDIDLRFSGGLGSSVIQSRSSGQQSQWNFVDTVSLSQGLHQTKLGIDFRRLAPLQQPSTPVFGYEYDSSNSVQTNSADTLFVQSNAPAYPIYLNFSAFAEDEWRISPKLSLSMGLRWDVNPAPGTAKGGLPYTGEGNSLSTLTLAPPGTALWMTDWYAFAPRLGAAFIIRDSPGWETVARGGGGVFFDTGQQLGSYGYAGPGFSAQNILGTSFGVPASFPALLAQVVPAIANPPAAPYTNSTPFVFPAHMQLPYTLQWNVAIEQALGKSQALTVSYVGASGRRLLGFNQVQLSGPPLLAPINSNFGNVFFIRSGLTSDYDALQVQYQRRLSHGLQALASYTWAHGIDFGSNNSSLPYIRGNSDFDVRQNFSSAFSYDLPDILRNRFASAVLHHWSIDDRFTARTGFPVPLDGSQNFDPATGKFFFGTLDTVPGQPLYIYGQQCAAFYNNGLGCPGGRAINPDAFANPPTDPNTGQNTRPGNAPRNFVRGFGAWQMDLAIRREFPIYEGLKLQFRAEAFNIFNHPNFGQIYPYYCNPSNQPGCIFGQADKSLADSLGTLNSIYQMGGSRSMQFAMKLMF